MDLLDLIINNALLAIVLKLSIIWFAEIYDIQGKEEGYIRSLSPWMYYQITTRVKFNNEIGELFHGHLGLRLGEACRLFYFPCTLMIWMTNF